MAQVPSKGRIVLYHHPGDGLADGNPQDYPAMILEVSGGPIISDTLSLEGEGDDRQTEGRVAASSQRTIRVLCWRSSDREGREWRRCGEGVGSGTWSWISVPPSPLVDEVDHLHDTVAQMSGSAWRSWSRSS